jgi:hypothetical protein
MNRGEPQVVDTKEKSFTRITFVPDLAKFGLANLDSDIVSLFTKRVYDIATPHVAEVPGVPERARHPRPGRRPPGSTAERGRGGRARRRASGASGDPTRFREWTNVYLDQRIPSALFAKSFDLRAICMVTSCA